MMGLGKLLHSHREHAAAGDTIDHPQAFELFATIVFLGRRREVYTRLATLSGIRPGYDVLDVGCGTGYLTRILAPVAGPNGHVTGVDPSPAMIEHARRRSPANCTYLVGEGQALDLPDASFDLVISSLAVHHIPAEARGDAIREMFRVLRPGGRLLIAESRPPSPPLAAWAANLLLSSAMRHDLDQTLNRLVVEAGFRIEEEGRLPLLLSYLRATRPA